LRLRGNKPAGALAEICKPLTDLAKLALASREPEGHAFSSRTVVVRSMRGKVVIFTIVAVACAGTAVVMGLLAGYWLLRNNLRTLSAQKRELQLARKELRGVRDLALRVAKDVDWHAVRVQQINDKLAVRRESDLDAVVGAIDNLVQANKQLLLRMADTETRMCEHARALETYVLEARTDALTGLPNRRGLDAELTSHADDFRRQGTPFSIVLLDLDRFKRINDQFGYEFGDEVLRGIARLLPRPLVGMQRVSRYGGEEFLVTLPGKTLQEACRTAEELRRSVAQARFHFQRREVLVTVSAGVAELMPGEPILGLLDRAEQALLSAKANWPEAICRHDGRAIHSLQSGEPEIHNMEADEELARPPETLQEGPAALPLPPIECDRSRIFFNVRQRIAETKRGGTGFALMLLRMDGGARPAGISGQPASEDSIQAMRRMLAANLREMDIVGRYAQGCFVLLLPQSNLADAVVVAERLVHAADQSSVSTRSGSQSLAVSAGIAEVQETDDAVALFQRAEAALAAAQTESICANDGTSIKFYMPLESTEAVR
jgi:diguanylate cyclase